MINSVHITTIHCVHHTTLLTIFPLWYSASGPLLTLSRTTFFVSWSLPPPSHLHRRIEPSLPPPTHPSAGPPPYNISTRRLTILETPVLTTLLSTPNSKPPLLYNTLIPWPTFLKLLLQDDEHAMAAISQASSIGQLMDKLSLAAGPNTPIVHCLSADDLTSTTATGVV